VGVLLRVFDLEGLTVRVFDLEGVKLGVFDLEAVMVALALLLGVWVGLLDALRELVRDGDDPLLVERLGVLLKEDVVEGVSVLVSEAVADLEGDWEEVGDLLGERLGDLEGDTDLEGVKLGVFDLEGVMVVLALLLGVWVGLLDALTELVRDGDEPLLVERLGVLLKEDVVEGVSVLVSEAVADLEADWEEVGDLLGDRLGDLEGDADLEGVKLGVLDLEAVMLVLGVWVGLLDALIELVRDGDEPPLIERLGVLLNEDVVEGVGVLVTEGVTDLEGDWDGVGVLLGDRLGDLEGLGDLLGLTLGDLEGVGDLLGLTVGEVEEETDLEAVKLGVFELEGVMVALAVLLVVGLFVGVSVADGVELDEADDVKLKGNVVAMPDLEAVNLTELVCVTVFGNEVDFGEFETEAVLVPDSDAEVVIV